MRQLLPRLYPYLYWDKTGYKCYWQSKIGNLFSFGHTGNVTRAKGRAEAKEDVQLLDIVYNQGFTGQEAIDKLDESQRLDRGSN